ncbi:MAG TPA: MlaD family protein [Rhodanobacteraceae bacterium]|nr:MlaD family protein [Rhodanobacteraceae bacterium]
METRAHHVLIGAFTLVIVLCILIFALWLAKTSVAQQYKYYDIVFSEAVTGLSQGGAVQYNGINVGTVAQLKLDPKDPRKVLVRIRVDGDTPIKVDTRAKLGLTGLTGIAFIQLTGGTPNSAPLTAPDDEVPRIQADNSALQKLLSGSEHIVTNVNEIIARANHLLSPQNVQHMHNTLAHLDALTGAVAGEREDLKILIAQLAEASKRMNATLAQTSKLTQTANALLGKQGKATLEKASAAMASLQDASRQLDELLSNNSASLNRGMQGLSQLGPAIKELRATLQSLRMVTQRLEENPRSFLLGGDHPKEFVPQ